MKVIVAVGLPGSGKSTYFERRHLNPFSSDEIRQELTGDAQDQTVNEQVFQKLRAQVESARETAYIDATNITREDRKQWFKPDRELEAIYFDVPLAICKARNAARARTVPGHVLELMAARLVPPSLEEGFSKVEVVRYLP